MIAGRMGIRIGAGHAGGVADCCAYGSVSPDNDLNRECGDVNKAQWLQGIRCADYGIGAERTMCARFGFGATSEAA